MHSRSLPHAVTARSRSAALLVALTVGVISPLQQVFAQTTGEPTAEPACESVTVLDFITDAAGRSFSPGDIVASQYRHWGIDISAIDTQTQPALALLAELSSRSGAVNALQVGNGAAGTITLKFQSLLSVEAVKLANVTVDGAAIVVHDRLQAQPAVVPVGAAPAGEMVEVNLSVLGAATQLDLRLVEGSGLTEVVLCPQSTPKQVPRHQTPRLMVELASAGYDVTAGQSVEVAMTVRNLGGAVGYDLTLWQSLPSGLVFADDGRSMRMWELGAIGPGGAYTFGYQVRAATDAPTGAVTSYVVGLISNGRGADGAAGTPMTFRVRGGRVLGVEIGEPTPAPAPVLPAPTPEPQASPTPAEEKIVVPAEPPEPTPAAPPRPTPTPERAAPSPAERLPTGGPEEEAEEPVSAEGEGVATTTEPAAEAEEGMVKPTPAEEELPLAGAVGTTTATTTAATVDCTSWLWILILLNAVLIGMLAQRERKGGAGEGTRWVVAMLLVAVPLIIWYPACELNWWLVVTAVGIGGLWYWMGTAGKPSAPTGSTPGGGAPGGTGAAGTVGSPPGGQPWIGGI